MIQKFLERDLIPFIAFAAVVALAPNSFGQVVSCISAGIAPGGSLNYLVPGESSPYTWTFVTSPPGCAWNIANVSQWLTITGSATASPNYIHITPSTNGDPATRIGGLDITDSSGNVLIHHSSVQNTTLCSFQMAPPSLNFDSGGGTGSISVTTSPTSAGCQWLPSQSATWITNYPELPLVGSQSFGFVALPATDSNPRTTGFLLYGPEYGSSPIVSVNEDGISAAILTFSCNPATGTVIAGAPYSLTCIAGGGSPPYVWSYSGLPTWLTGLSNGSTLTFSGIPPVGLFNFPVTVSDSSAPPQTQTQNLTVSAVSGVCTAALPATSLNYLVPGDTGNYNWQFTTTPAGCIWYIANASSWLTISASVTSNPSFIKYTASTNNDPATRTGGLDITDGVNVLLHHSVVQNTTLCSFQMSPPSLSFGSGGGTGTIDVATSPSSASCQWLPGQSLAWVSNYPSLPLVGSQSFNFQVAPAPDVNSRATSFILYGPEPSTSPTVTVNEAGVSPAILTLSCNPINGRGTVGAPYTVTCTAGGGTAPYKFSPSGLPAWMSGTASGGNTFTVGGYPANAGTFNFAVAVNDNSNPPQTLTQSLSVVIPSLQAISIGPLTLNFDYQSGTVPAQVPQALSVFSNIGPVAFSAKASQSWILLSPANGTTPASLGVTVAGGLAPGVYTGQISFASAGLSSFPIVSVNLTVTQPSPILSLLSSRLSFDLAQGASAIPGQIQVSNAGGGTLQFSAASDVPWLQLSASNPTSATPSGPALLQFAVNPANLAVGTYMGTITVGQTSGSASTQVVAVILSVNPVQLTTMLLGQTGLVFNAVPGGATTPSISVAVAVAGAATVKWTASASTLSGGNWLKVSSPGSSTAAASSDVTVTASPVSGMAPGQYFGSVQVSAPGVANAPQTITVQLNVVKSGSIGSGPVFSSTGVILVAAQGSTATVSQPITMYNLDAQPLACVGSAHTEDGGSWLVSPGDGVLSTTLQLPITANPAGLSSGIKYGTVQVEFSDGTVHTVQVALLVTGNGTAGTAAEHPRPSEWKPSASGSCNELVLQYDAPEQDWNYDASSPIPVRVHASACGNVINNLSIETTFQDDPATYTLTFDPISEDYTYSWTPPPGAGAGPVTIDSLTSFDGGLYGAKAPFTINLIAPTTSDPPSVTPAFGAADYNPIIATGGYVSLFGTRLSNTKPSASATSTPFETSLGNTEVFLNGEPLPLAFVSPGQINALVPHGLTPSAHASLVVQRNDDETQSTPVYVAVSSVQPGIFVLQTAAHPQSTQGAVTNAVTGIVAGSSNEDPSYQPVTRGGYIAIYCTGLGAVAEANAPGDGQATPTISLFNTVANVTASLGGVSGIPVLFSGLTPGAVALYQVNVQVPNSVTPGDQVPLTITTTDPGGKQISNEVTIAVE